MRNLVRLPLPITAACLLFLSPQLSAAFAGDTLAPGQTLRGGDTLSSANGRFELGFFNLSASRNRYLGIWFKGIEVPMVVWVANRERPITNTSGGVLEMRSNGTLVLRNEVSEVVWSSGELSVPSPFAQLLDTGNFVVRDAPSQTQSFSWQSFDFPDRVMLPGARMTPGTKGHYAWQKDDDDPSPSEYHSAMDPHGDIIVYQGPSRKRYRTGPWNGLSFSGIPDDARFHFNFVSNKNETYYAYDVEDRSLLTVIQITDAGVAKRLFWSSSSKEWKEYWSVPKDKCDEYATCGAFGICTTDYWFFCRCLPGFEPRSPNDWYWDPRNGTDRCVRRRELNCSGDGFYELRGVKLPDMTAAITNRSMGLGECREVCLRDCSCTAYTSANISGAESGCVIWSGDLIDIRQYSNMGQHIYIRLEASELDLINGGPGKRKKRKIIATVLALAISMLVLFSACCIWRKKRKAGTSKGKTFSPSTEKDMELPMFSWNTIATATDFFSVANILGQGGFGPVYKGKLEDGREIAVKRSSKKSGQGVDEFNNEIMLIIKLQHRNLVRLLGCCIEGDETMLVYEYLANKSLDNFIFDKRKSTLLNWQKRLDIILGIARGLLYLHQDSRLRIIHRDLKASNILLDEEMNPKISDFGAARIFKGEQIKENTRRVIGTYGYMSPEYVMGGIFSVKSDVFSFGVLLLEIISGKKNRSVYQSDPRINLLGHAWVLWNDGSCLELLDKSVDHPHSISEIIRCIQIGLLCVQERADDRPTMMSVVSMLGSNSMALPMPKRPGFCTIRVTTESGWSSNGKQLCTTTDITLTELEGR